MLLQTVSFCLSCLPALFLICLPLSSHLFLSASFRAAPSTRSFPLSTEADNCWALPPRQKARPRWAPIPLPAAPVRLSTGNELSAPPLDTSHNILTVSVSQDAPVSGIGLNWSTLYGTCKHMLHTVTNSDQMSASQLPPGPWRCGQK